MLISLVFVILVLSSYCDKRSCLWSLVVYIWPLGGRWVHLYTFSHLVQGNQIFYFRSCCHDTASRTEPADLIPNIPQTRAHTRGSPSLPNRACWHWSHDPKADSSRQQLTLQPRRHNQFRTHVALSQLVMCFTTPFSLQQREPWL